MEKPGRAKAHSPPIHRWVCGSNQTESRRDGRTACILSILYKNRQHGVYLAEHRTHHKNSRHEKDRHYWIVGCDHHRGCIIASLSRQDNQRERRSLSREHLAGVWLRTEDNLPRGVEMPLSMRCTNIVAPDGSFVERSWFSHSDRTNTYQRTGTWLVKNGHLIETIKTSTNPTEVTPHTGAGRIVYSDARGFIVRWPNSQETVWQKVIR